MTSKVKEAAHVPLFLDCSRITYANPQPWNEPPAYEADTIFQVGQASGEMKRYCMNRHFRLLTACSSIVPSTGPAQAVVAA
jgi:hypothetical protein